jgi:hypothetical protein
LEYFSRESISKKNGRKRREAAKDLALTASRGVSSKWLVTIIDAFRRKRFPFSINLFLASLYPENC